MRKLLTYFALFVVVSALAPAALHADTLSFTATGSGFESSGTLTVTPDSTYAGLFDVTNISGEVNGVAITGLLPGSYNPGAPTTNSTGVFIFDNLIGGSPMLDYNGIGFNIGNSGYQGNFYFNAGNYQFLDSNAVNTTLDSFVTGAAPTPEPSTLMLLGTGAIGLAGAVRRRLAA